MKKITFKKLKDKIEQSEADVTLVHVWATWCPPCVEEFPAIVKIAEEYEEKAFNIILISADRPNSTGRVVDFLTDHDSPVGSWIAANPQKIVKNLHGAWSGGIPASFFYGKNGEVKEWWAGGQSFSKYRKTIDRLLKERSQEK